MNEKKEKIIEAAMKLFAEKGYHATSIQEVADRSGVSKGAVYLHFSSKDDIIVSIFKYYYETMRAHISHAEEAPRLSPKESFIKQLQAYFNETRKYKEFIMMQFSEQALPFNKEIKLMMQDIHKETHEWYERNLLKIYGSEIEPFMLDIITIYDGILHSYLRLLFMNKLDVDFDRLPNFLYNRGDDLIKSLVNSQEKPLIFDRLKNTTEEAMNTTNRLSIQSDLHKIKQALQQLNLSNHEKSQLQETVVFLLDELKKEEIKGFIFKGMLANFHSYPKLNDIAIQIAQKLSLK